MCIPILNVHQVSKDLEDRWVHRHIRGTVQFEIHYNSEGTPLLVGFTDSDWVGDLDDRKSTTGYVFSLGYGPVSWDCKKQQALTLSSAEVEYRAAFNVSQEALWI